MYPEAEEWPRNCKHADGPKNGRPVEPCGDGCPDLERGDCKPSGDLYFILEKRVTFELFENLTVVGYFGRPGVSRMGSRIEKLKPASQGEQLSG